MWQPWHRDSRETADTVYLKATDLKDSDRELFDRHYHFSAYDNAVLGNLSRIRLLRNKMKIIFNLINCLNYVYKFFKIKFLNKNSKDLTRKGEAYRIIDKTPPNCFRIEYLASLYPDAKFIYITRNGIDNVSSLMNAWRSKKKFQFTYRKYLEEYLSPLEDGSYFKIDGYKGDVWKFAMPEGWENYRDKPLAEVCAFQWLKTHEAAIDSFSKIDDKRIIRIKFEDLMQNTRENISELCEFLEINFSPKMQQIVNEMPLVNTFSPASKHKARKNQPDLERIAPLLDEMQERLGYPKFL